MSAAVFLSGTPAAPDVLRQGTASIPLLATIIAVPDAAIKADSVVVCWGVGAVNATATAFSIDVIDPGVGFSVSSDVAPTIAAKTVGWAVLKY